MFAKWKIKKSRVESRYVRKEKIYANFRGRCTARASMLADEEEEEVEGVCWDECVYIPSSFLCVYICMGIRLCICICMCVCVCMCVLVCEGVTDFFRFSPKNHELSFSLIFHLILEMLYKKLCIWRCTEQHKFVCGS